MTGRERILAALRGEPVDRVPLWLMDSFATIDPPDPWTEAWMEQDDNFLAVRRRYWNSCELFYEYKRLSPYGLCNRMLSIPPSFISVEEERTSGKRRTVRFRIEAPAGTLRFTIAWDRGVATPWQIEHPVKNLEDAAILLSIPPDADPELEVGDFAGLEARIGERGIPLVLINTPLVTVSSAFSFEDYLVCSITEPNLIEEMTEIAFGRIVRILRLSLEAGLGPVFRIMGSEQATPPMGSPELYRKLVHRCEKAMIDLIHQHGRLAAVHCHGNVRQVLPLMVEAGVDLLDPVEAPPSGDVAFSEAAEIAGGQMTLAGNLQYDDLAVRSADEIVRQVRGILADGPKNRTIVSSTGYPITAISSRMRDNYLALIDAVLEYGWQ